MAVQFIVEALGWPMCSRMWERNVTKSQGPATLERFQVHPQSRVYRTIPSKTNDRSLCLTPLVCVFLCVLVSQSCSIFCDPMGCSLPGSSVLGILQARIVKWVAIPCSRGSSQHSNQTQFSWIAGTFFTIWATKEAKKKTQKLIKKPLSWLLHDN